MGIHASLRSEIAAFCNRHAMKPSTFGRQFGDPRLFFDLQRGRQPRPETETRVRQWMREQDIAVAARLRAQCEERTAA